MSAAEPVIRAVKEQFARHGVLFLVLQSDGGSQFVSREFQDVASIRGGGSSPYNSQWNGKAKSAVLRLLSVFWN